MLFWKILSQTKTLTLLFANKMQKINQNFLQKPFQHFTPPRSMVVGLPSFLQRSNCSTSSTLAGMASTLVSPRETLLISRITAGDPSDRSAKRAPVFRIGIIPMRPSSSARLRSRRMISRGRAISVPSPSMRSTILTNSCASWRVRLAATQRATAAIPPMAPQMSATPLTKSMKLMAAPDLPR